MELFQGLHAFPWTNPTENNCNTFLIDRGKRILIDPGLRRFFGNIKNEFARLSLSPADMDLVLVTHCHPDHIEAAKDFLGESGTVAISALEMEFIRRMPQHVAHMYGASDFEPHILLQEGDLTVGDMAFQVIPAPGHSPGSICLYWPETKVLFSGDVVFHQGVGRTDFPGGNGEALKESINRLSELDVEFLLSGHGDMVVGKETVQRNFEHIKQVWFAYI